MQQGQSTSRLTTTLPHSAATEKDSRTTLLRTLRTEQEVSNQVVLKNRWSIAIINNASYYRLYDDRERLPVCLALPVHMYIYRLCVHNIWKECSYVMHICIWNCTVRISVTSYPLLLSVARWSFLYNIPLPMRLSYTSKYLLHHALS